MGRVVIGDDGEELVEEEHRASANDSGGIFGGWLAWNRRSRKNRIFFVLSILLAAFVTLAFGWGSFNPAPEGDGTLYMVFYWIWGLCAVGLVFGLAEWKTSPLRRNAERGHLFILLYTGALLIVTRTLVSVLYGGYL